MSAAEVNLVGQDSKPNIILRVGALFLGGKSDKNGYTIYDRFRLLITLVVFVVMGLIPRLYILLGGEFVSHPMYLFIGSHFYFLVWLIMWGHDKTHSLFELYIAAFGLTAPLIGIFVHSMRFSELHAEYFLLIGVDPWWVYLSALVLYLNLRVFQARRYATGIESSVPDSDEAGDETFDLKPDIPEIFEGENNEHE